MSARTELGHDEDVADRDKDIDIEKLLAEVEGSVSGRPSRPSGAPDRSRQSIRAGLSARVSTAAVSGVVAAGVIFVLFAMLPFLGAISGAAGAFLATFVSVLLLARR